MFLRDIEVAHLDVTSAEMVVAALKNVSSWSARHSHTAADNVLQYSGTHFKDFVTEYGFTHITSSPRDPQANGEDECAAARVEGFVLWNVAILQHNSSWKDGYLLPYHCSQHLYGLFGPASEALGSQRGKRRRNHKSTTT